MEEILLYKLSVTVIIWKFTRNLSKSCTHLLSYRFCDLGIWVQLKWKQVLCFKVFHNAAIKVLAKGLIGRFDWGRLQIQVHVVVGVVQFFMGFWVESLSSPLNVDQSPSSIICQVGLSNRLLASLKHAGHECTGRPRGIGWRGRWEGGSGWGTHVNPWLIHFNV